MKKALLWLSSSLMALLSLSSLEATAQTDIYDIDSDEWYYPLDSIIHSGFRPNSPLRGNLSQGLNWSSEMMEKLPKFLGYTDPLRYVHLLPGVQTSTEYDSGIHIQGCDNSHNDIAINGVPLYGVTHLFGLFSVFNTAHYPRVNFNHSNWYYDPNRLGGSIDMALPEENIQVPVEGDFNVGVMSAQGTLRVKTGKSSTLFVSARQAYINLLYKRWLHIGGDAINYGFGDYNLSWFANPTANDKIWVDGYFGYDKASTASSLIDNLYQDVSIDWGNAMGAAHWKHTFNDWSVLTQSVFTTTYHTTVDLNQTEINMYLPSRIVNSGYKAHLDHGTWNAGTQINYYHVLPQDPHVTGGDYNTGSQQYTQQGLELSVYGGYRHNFDYKWEIETGAKGTIYVPIFSKDTPEIAREKTQSVYGGVSPMVSLSYTFPNAGKLSAIYSWNQQYLFQGGVSNLGLPIEYWFTCGEYGKPQYSQGVSMGYELSFGSDMYSLSADIYYKRLYNQIEYRGDLFDFVSDAYDMNNYLLHGKGHNFGLNLLFHKRSGSFTGWVSYALGRSLRQFVEEGYNDGYYPSTHERIHELNLVGSYQLRRWNFGATFVCASGSPFTGTEGYFMSSGRIIAKYGRYNGCRMRPYIRLDLNVNVDFVNNEKMQNGLSFSLYNALGRRNDTGYRLVVDDKNAKHQSFRYIQNHFLLRFVPGVSYYHKF